MLIKLDAARFISKAPPTPLILSIRISFQYKKKLITMYVKIYIKSDVHQIHFCLILLANITTAPKSLVLKFYLMIFL